MLFSVKRWNCWCFNRVYRLCSKYRFPLCVCVICHLTLSLISSATRNMYEKCQQRKWKWICTVNILQKKSSKRWKWAVYERDLNNIFFFHKNRRWQDTYLVFLYISLPKKKPNLLKSFRRWHSIILI